MEQFLRMSLRLGALYDLVLGTFIVLAGRRIIEPRPDSFLFILAALPLFLMALVYWSASRAADIRAFRPVVYGARGFGGLYILVLVLWLHPASSVVYSIIALLDWAWLAVHHLLWKQS